MGFRSLLRMILQNVYKNFTALLALTIDEC